jgi:hypothetical protein
MADTETTQAIKKCFLSTHTHNIEFRSFLLYLRSSINLTMEWAKSEKKSFPVYRANTSAFYRIPQLARHWQFQRALWIKWGWRQRVDENYFKWTTIIFNYFLNSPNFPSLLLLTSSSSPSQSLLWCNETKQLKGEREKCVSMKIEWTEIDLIMKINSIRCRDERESEVREWSVFYIILPLLHIESHTLAIGKWFHFD